MIQHITKVLIVFICIEMPLQSNAVDIDFARDIQPIFAQNCTICHGPDKQKAGLNLTDEQSIRAKLKSGRNTVVSGDPDGSELIRRISSDDTDDLMPPPDHGKRLAPDQTALIRRWIVEGGQWSRHWAYRPLTPVFPPRVKNVEWSRNPIDYFILARQESNDIAPSPEANRYTLIRRLYYDLIGLPPSPQEADAFVKNGSPDAYENLVDRLLASPRFGERWGRHWLDKARYADSDGYEKDNPRMNAWLYRDWVIKSINADLPYDQFTVEQLAGDLLNNANNDQRLATAFNRQTLTNTEGGTDQEQWRVAAIMDRVETFGTVWLGITAICGRCHSHKYDQFTQNEYYELFAYFNNGDETSTNLPISKEAMSKHEKEMDDYNAQVKILKQKITAHDRILRNNLPAFEKELLGQIGTRKDSPVIFHPLETTTLRGPKGVTFKKQKDDSLLVSGANPAKAEYTLEFMSGIKNITGLKIEVLPDKSLGANGPGRTAHGNFVLNDVRVYAAPGAVFDAKKHRVTLSDAKADYSQNDWPAKNAIDGKVDEGTKGTGWAVAPKFGKEHHLIVTFSRPVAFKGPTHLQVVLDQQYGTQHTIGRFRITVRTGQAPTDGIPENIVKLLDIDSAEHDAKQTETLLTFSRGRDAVAKKLAAQMAKLTKGSPKAPLMSVRIITQRTKNPRSTHFLHRGEFKQPKAELTPDTPGILPIVKHRADTGDRLDLARWLVDGRNPLTPRVTINHVWSNLFGSGLVRTPNDFGVRGEAPTHPKLIDWLAGELIQRNWSQKAMIKLIVTTATYRQASFHRPALLEKDPDNKLIHRQNRFRVEAEIIRDLHLSASDLLTDQIGGPSVFPPLPAGVASLSYANNLKWNTSNNADRYRRGMYTFFKRTSPHPNLTTFDCPDSNITCVKRGRSNTPLAALATLNNTVFTEAAKALAKRVLNEKTDEANRIDYCFRLCVARPPTSSERAALASLLNSARDYFRSHEAEAKSYNGNPNASAWAATARIMLNMDEFIMRE
ncbi:MAG: DUF1553 domain-containing protein [Proteobacteria bacterium]|jgi:hypothetical protein|nr:DUF1553 domain-containing protein [Pseudomonadota bacterium]